MLYKMQDHYCKRLQKMDGWMNEYYCYNAKCCIKNLIHNMNNELSHYYFHPVVYYVEYVVRY